MNTRCISALAFFSLTGLAVAGPVFDINFEPPACPEGASFEARTNRGNLAGSAPAMITDITTRDGVTDNAWTASVVKSLSDEKNHWLKFDIPAGTAFSGRIQAHDPYRINKGDTGTWFLQFDYTPLEGEGGFLGGWTFIDVNGIQISNHINNHPFFFDSIAGGPRFTPGKTSRVRLEIDMGSSAATAFRVFVDGKQVVAQPAFNNIGNELGGFAFHLAGESNPVFNSATSFAFDNILFGPVEASK
ncbi:hypothetical protein OpiT1DRAFT_05962 [Opitutaceae bacterium TAV1]|nr:hypothetical protein OpiT1DRAFT_05962 [Opitutaceae bacterium TAV1]